MKVKLAEEGFAISENLFTLNEIDEVLKVIQSSKEVQKHFAIRQFFEKVPASKQLIFNQKFITFFKENIDGNYFLVKAIYFDKPPDANWIVPWHQDLTIVTNKRMEIAGYSKWRLKMESNMYNQRMIF